MATKRPKLSDRGDEARLGTGNPVRISGICLIGERPAEEVLVTDISQYGCKLQVDSIGVTKGECFTLRLAQEAPITGRLSWIRHGSLGVAFDAPLDDAVFTRLLAMVAPDNVVALRRSEAR